MLILLVLHLLAILFFVISIVLIIRENRYDLKDKVLLAGNIIMIFVNIALLLLYYLSR